MKHLHLLLLMLLAMLLMTGIALAEAPVAPLDGFAFSIDGDSATLTGYTGGASQVTVPGYYMCRPVTAIGDGAFSGQGQLTSVSLPNTVSRIGAGAFRNCTSLTSLSSYSAGEPDHSWDEGVAQPPATCTQDGVMLFTCQNCLETKTETIPAAHTWDEGVTTLEPTDDAEGEKTFTCSVCQETKTESIPALKPAGIPGDANEDGKVSLKDAVLILQYTVDDTKTLNLVNADVNGDGAVTLKDAVAVLRMTL